MLTTGQAACFIYNLPFTTENEQMSLKNLETAGLEPIHLSDGDPYSPLAMGTKKIDREPWKYKRYSKKEVATEIKIEVNEESSVSSFEVSIPTSRRAVVDRMKLIFPLDSYNTTTTFMTEDDIYDVVKDYLPENHRITAKQLNYWIGQEGHWPGVKRKQINNERKSGRMMNLVNNLERDFTWNDITNVQDF